MQKLADTIPAVNKKAPGRIPEQNFQPLRFEHKWISTLNEKKLQDALLVAGKSAGDGVLFELTAPAGRGKSKTVKRHASHNGCIYLLCIETWKRSELPMLQALCRELGIASPPGRANDCFLRAAERLIAEPRIIFFDEVDLVPQRINLIRQLVEVVGGIFVLIGEESLRDHMTRNERVWSRTFRSLYFEPISLSEIILYGRESGGLDITGDAASEMFNSPGGRDWRVIKRLTLELVQIANAFETWVVSKEMAQQAIKMGLKPEGRRIGKGTPR